jgi:4-aminobutyrate aminotransferase
LTTIEIIEEEGLALNAARVGAVALDHLAGMKARQPAIGDVRGRGLLIGIDLVTDRATRAPDRALAERVLYRSLDRGLSFKTTMGNVLTLTPPLTVTEAEMLDALAIIEEAIALG